MDFQLFVFKAFFARPLSPSLFPPRENKVGPHGSHAMQFGPTDPRFPDDDDYFGQAR